MGMSGSSKPTAQGLARKAKRWANFGNVKNARSAAALEHRTTGFDAGYRQALKDIAKDHENVDNDTFDLVRDWTAPLIDDGQ